LIHAGSIQRGNVRIETDYENITFGAIKWIFERCNAEVYRFNGGHTVAAQSLVQAPLRESFWCDHVLVLRIDQNQVTGQMRMQQRSTRQQCILETELRQHEYNGKSDPG